MIHSIQRFILPAAYSLLPAPMSTPDATALLLAIGLQESQFEARAQIGGPARGFWQFEASGVRGVLTHPASRVHARAVLDALGYAGLKESDEVLRVIEHNDILAAAFARLLLFTAPQKLPSLGDPASAWKYYLALWRPGRPRPGTWAGYHTQAANLTKSGGISTTPTLNA